jgi:CheY-like chemotaxis protein
MDNQTPIHVFLIEDNPGDRRLMQELLREVASVSVRLEYAESLSQGIQCLRENHFDIVLLDLFLPDSRGFSTFTQLQQQERDTPIVVTTGLNDETLALRAVQAGAQDYLVKGQITGGTAGAFDSLRDRTETNGAKNSRAGRLARHCHRRHSRARRAKSNFVLE